MLSETCELLSQDSAPTGLRFPLRSTILFLVLALASFVLVAEPRTAIAEPSATPTTACASIPQWLTQLADPDSNVRESAKQNLLDLDPANLKDLVDAVKSVGPLLPAQMAAIREVVPHLYLRTQTYDASPNTGFMGVDFSQSMSSYEESSVVIGTRKPGFVAYAKLRDGDRIVSILDTPTAITNTQQFVAAIKEKSPGDLITLKVRRSGKLLTISFKLDARPASPQAADNNIPNMPPDSIPADLFPTRDRMAQQYWDEHFAPLMLSGAN